MACGVQRLVGIGGKPQVVVTVHVGLAISGVSCYGVCLLSRHHRVGSIIEPCIHGITVTTLGVEEAGV